MLQKQKLKFRRNVEIMCAYLKETISKREADCRRAYR